MLEEIIQLEAGFRTERGTRDHTSMLNVGNFIEKCRGHIVELYLCLIDYSKSCDCVQEEMRMWNVMADIGLPVLIIELINSLYSEQQAAVRVEEETSELFKAEQ